MLIGFDGIGLSDDTEATNFNRKLRSFLGGIDATVYVVLGGMYKIFFNVASADIFSSETILDVYKRFQLIIGVYMVFQLAFIIIKGIFNVEEVSGSKNNEFIKRVIIALSMLTLLTPISIPNAKNEFEKRVNNNGLLFGTLYSLQYRILNNNTIGRLVLGSNSKNNSNSSSDENTLASSANLFSNTIIKTFVRINLKSGKLENPKDGSSNPETNKENWMCKDLPQKNLDIYLSEESTPYQLFGLVYERCSGPRYQFTYMYVIPFAIGFIFIFLLASFTIDIAIRSIKLAVLRIVAPIPIIGYIDPRGGKDSGFNSWLKTLIQTYVELFIRLAVIYFVIYIIQDIIRNGLIIDNAGGFIGLFSVVFIFIGLFLFAKEAPKFLQNAIGLKSEPGSIFGKALGRTGAALGTIGSMRAGRIASYKADLNKDLAMQAKDPNYVPKRDNLLNRGKHILSGMSAGVTALGGGMNAVQNAKGDFWKTGRDVQKAQNARLLENGKAGSTFFGRLKSGGQELFRGETRYDEQANKVSFDRAQHKAIKDKYDYVEGKALKDYSNKLVELKHNGVEYKNVSIDSFNQAKAEATAKMNSFDENGNRRGDGTFTYCGQTFDVNSGDIQKFEKELKESTMTLYKTHQQEAYNEIGYDNIYDKEGQLTQTAKAVQTKLQDKYGAGFSIDNGYYQKDQLSRELDYDDIDKTATDWFKNYKQAEGRANYTEGSYEYQKGKADKGATDKK